MTPPFCEWIEWLHWYEAMPAKFSGTRGYFEKPPTHLIIHSGSLGAGVSEWFFHPYNRVKKTWRKYWAHFAWSSKHFGFCQCESLQQTASHAPPYNDFSVGIELPGPAKQKIRPDHQHQLLRYLVKDLVEAVPTITKARLHSEIDPRKSDPGPGFKKESIGDIITWV